MLEIKFEKLKGKSKIIIMAALLIIAIGLTYYFHAIVKTCIFFTHFFYIPIILAAIWWKEKGLAVPVFLAILLILSNIFLRVDTITANDYLRALMFMVVALVATSLSVRIAKAEKILKDNKKWLSITLNSIGDGVIATDTKGNITYTNPVAESLTGWNREEAKGKRLNDIFNIVNEYTGKEVEDPVTRVIKHGLIAGLANHTILIAKDGKKLPIDDCGAPIHNKEGDIIGVVLVFRDVTETKRLQDFAARAQKLETASRIAGQIAHDFNNLLAPLIAYPDFIKETLPKNHPALEYIDDMEKSAESISEINQQLLTLGRRGHYNQEPMNLNETINRVVNQMEPIPDTLIIELDLNKDLMNIMGGPSQIFRVISNLLTNAREALQDIGQLTIKTENYYVDKMFGKFGRIPKGEYVKLTIADTGCGIPDDVMPKIFDPFFTTKTTDKVRGSGLGLSVVHGVVEDHDGYIDVETTVGKETSFYLYFPITREALEKIEDERIIGGAEKVLIVDDDSIQREVTLKLLKKLGYRAQAVESGEKALGFVKENPQDLIVLDMVMPGGIDGAETYRKVLEINPNQKAIIVSGYTETDRVKEVMNLGVGAFIKKPLTLNTTARAVRKELDR